MMHLIASFTDAKLSFRQLIDILLNLSSEHSANLENEIRGVEDGFYRGLDPDACVQYAVQILGELLEMGNPDKPDESKKLIFREKKIEDFYKNIFKQCEESDINAAIEGDGFSTLHDRFDANMIHLFVNDVMKMSETVRNEYFDIINASTDLFSLFCSVMKVEGKAYEKEA